MKEPIGSGPSIEAFAVKKLNEALPEYLFLLPSLVTRLSTEDNLPPYSAGNPPL